jgi:hypothetical protein
LGIRSGSIGGVVSQHPSSSREDGPGGFDALVPPNHALAKNESQSVRRSIYESFHYLNAPVGHVGVELYYPGLRERQQRAIFNVSLR